MKNFIIKNDSGKVVLSNLTELQQIELFAWLLKNGFVKQKIVDGKLRFYDTTKGQIARHIANTKK